MYERFVWGQFSWGQFSRVQFSRRQLSGGNCPRTMLRLGTLLNERLQHSCFPVSFTKVFRATVLKNTSRQLLLHFYSNYFQKIFWFFWSQRKLFCFLIFNAFSHYLLLLAIMTAALASHKYFKNIFRMVGF